MKKITCFFLAFLFGIVGAYAQHYSVTENNYNTVKIAFTPAKLETQKIKTTNGNFTRIYMDDCTPSREIGMPQLPVMVKLLEIPLCDSLIVNVTNSQYQEYDAATLGIENQIYPAQQEYPKSYTGPRTFSKDVSVYRQDAFYSLPLASVKKIGVMRDVNLANIFISPVSYNPVTNKVRIYTSIEVEVTYVNPNEPGTYEMKAKYGSPLFHAATDAIINPLVSQDRSEYSAAPIRYLIIANSMFADNSDLTSFVNWKKRMGYIVTVAYTSDANVGTTTTSIKNYIMSQYTGATTANPAPTYLLLIGDVAQIPTYTGVADNSHKTDLYYATWTSGDNIPDCYYGRFSAQNVDQLIPQIQKTLVYEQYTMSDPSYLAKAVLIAGTDDNYGPTHANGQINYISNNYINTSLNYTTVYTHLYDCTSQAATIRSEIGAGVGWANYTAHGSSDGWYQPEFNCAEVASMTNANKYGLMIGNCCQSGTFNDSECFGEALLRASNKGALAYIGASDYSYWDEDYYWAVGARSSVTSSPTYNASNLGAYDRIFHTHNEAQTGWYTTVGGLLTAGNLAVQSSSSSMSLYYWEIYHVFGDPSVKLYLGVPSTMTVSSSDVIMVGSTSYQVQAAPYAYVALTYNNELIGAAFADASGNATITFDAIQTPGQYEVAASAQNYIQYFKTVNVIVPSGSYVVASAVALNATSTPNIGSSVQWDLTLQNLGVASASNVSAKITCTTSGITLTQDSIHQGTMAVNATANLSNAFAATIANNIEDGTVAHFLVTVHFDNTTSTKNVNMTILAPQLTTGSYSATVNGSTSIAPGDLVTVSIVNHNGGHGILNTATAQLSSHYTGAHVNTGNQTISSLAAGADVNTTFNVQIRSNVAIGTIIPLYYHTFLNGNQSVDTLYLTVGTAMETFESNTFTAFSWLNNSTYPWEITSTTPYAGSFSARSKSSLGDNQTSTLQITLTAMMDGNFSYYRKVSSESGYDKLTVYIDGVSKEEQSGSVAWGYSSFPVTVGTHTYKFSYSKDYSTSSGSDCAWIDNLTFPGYGTMAVEDTLDGVGIQDITTGNDLLVYPNPAQNKVTVYSLNPMQQVTLFDLSGRMIDHIQTGSAQTATFNVSSLACGVYFIKVTLSNKQTVTTKFIKQ